MTSRSVERVEDLGRARPSAQQADRAWPSRQSYPFTSRFVDVHHQSVHYIDEGRGPLLLFLHGNVTWSFLYRHLIRRLANHFRCVALDYPGFGLSRADPDYDLTPRAHAGVVLEFIRKLNLPEFTIVAHDWGGPIGMAVTLARPDHVSGLILFNTFAWPAQGDAHFERFSRFMSSRIGRFLMMRFNLLVHLMMLGIFSGSTLSAEARRAYQGPFTSVDSRRALGVFTREILGSAELLATVEVGLATLASMPTLILWADRDVAFKPRHRRRLQAGFPSSTTIVLREAGHFAPEDVSERIAEHMRSWLQDRPSAAEPRSGRFDTVH